MDWKGYRLSYLTTLNEYEVSNTRLAMMRLEYRLFEHLTQYFLLETNNISCEAGWLVVKNK